jgi:hypothetical protein
MIFRYENHVQRFISAIWTFKSKIRTQSTGGRERRIYKYISSILVSLRDDLTNRSDQHLRSLQTDRLNLDWSRRWTYKQISSILNSQWPITQNTTWSAKSVDLEVGESED